MLSVIGFCTMCYNAFYMCPIPLTVVPAFIVVFSLAPFYQNYIHVEYSKEQWKYSIVRIWYWHCLVTCVLFL